MSRNRRVTRPRATKLARQAVAALDGHPDALDTLGYVYLKDDNPLGALKQFVGAIRSAETQQPSYHYHLGMAHRSLGQKGRAIQAFDRALAIDSEFSAAATARAEILQPAQVEGSPPTRGDSS